MSKSVLFLIIFAMTSGFSLAGHASTVYLGLGGSVNSSRSVDGNIETALTPSGMVGYQYENYFVYLSHFQRTQSSNEGLLNIEASWTETQVWAHYLGSEYYNIRPFIGLGLGLYEITSDTTVSNATTRNQSGLRPIGGGSFGLLTSWQFLFASVDVQIEMAEDYQSQPSLSSNFYFGFNF